jgi:hypothetical protein
MDYGIGPYAWVVSCGGVQVNAIWNQGISPWDGAQCVLALATLNKATTYYVMAVTDTRPSLNGMAKVTAFTGGSSTCTVTIYGHTYTAHRASSYTPTVGDYALCIEVHGQLKAICAMTAYTEPPITPAPNVAPNPSPSNTGNSLIPAQDSGTWTTALGGWVVGQDVYSGSGYIPPSTGAWFYGGDTAGLAGKTITALRLYLPARLNAGAYETAQNVNIYAHTSKARGTTEPSRVAGPVTVSVPIQWGGGWVPLDGSFATALQGGGGISIAGDPCIGFAGVEASGDSGAISADWSMA